MSRKPKQTPQEEIAQLCAELEEIKDDTFRKLRLLKAMPSGWSEVAKIAPTEMPRTKLTIALDRDVAEWYRSLGRGYQRHINAVLRAYMRAVATGQFKPQEQKLEWGEPIP